jgi:hypothetical protein
MDIINIFKCVLGRIDEFATKDEVKTLGHGAPIG